MKKIKVNVPKALATGVFNLFKTDHEQEFVLVIVHADGEFILPIITGKTQKAYIDPAIEEPIADVLDNLFSALVKEGSFADLKGVRATQRPAPEHSHKISGFVNTKGMKKSLKAEEALTKAGYELLASSTTAIVTPKDYSELLETSPEARDILEDMTKELATVGATYRSVGVETQEAHAAIIAGDAGGIIFEGPTGTGKTWNCKILAVHDKAPLLNAQITYGTTVEDLVGMFTPNTEEPATAAARGEITMLFKELSKLTKKSGESEEDYLTRYKVAEDKCYAEALKLINSTGGAAKWKFVPGPLLKAYHLGYQIYLDEINYGQAGVIACINQFTDGTRRVVINGITYKRNPNFVIYMTMNPGYEGTDPLNVALKNRFAKVNVPALNKDEFTRRMVGFCKGLGHPLSDEFFSRLYDFAGKIEHLGNSNEYHENVKFSIRNAQRLCEGILRKSKTFDEFAANIHIQYLNDLTADNDNSDRVEALKKEKTIINDIQSLYELYDFADIPVSDKVVSLDDFYTVTDDDADGTTGEGVDSELLKEEDLDDLLSGL